jgi:hypothetical protein
MAIFRNFVSGQRFYCIRSQAVSTIDEHSDFVGAQFIRELTTYDSSGQVTMLAVRIQGKIDTDEVVQCIWRDDDVPELCLV